MKPFFKVVILSVVVMTFQLSSCGQDPSDDVRVVFETLAPEDLPDIPFKDIFTSNQKKYLDIPDGPVTLSQIGADVLVIKYLNVHCPACQSQASIINKAYYEIQDRKNLRDRIKFMAVAAGNNDRETRQFREDYRIEFPVIPDPSFYSYDSVGNPGGLPFMLIVTIHPEGGGPPVAKGHAGIVRSARQLVEEAETALLAKEQDWAQRIEDLHLGEWKDLKMNVSDTYLLRLLKKSASEAGFEVENIQPVFLRGGNDIYHMTWSSGPGLWAKVAGRVAICNVCENIFFIIIFDDDGIVRSYDSVRVTKGNNILWDKEDDAFMKGRLVGRPLTEAVVFDPSVDSVTSATMSAALIFDTVRRLGDTYRLLKAEGLIGE